MFRVIRAGTASAIIVVLVIQIQHGLQHDFDVLNFLSYFTVLSNLAAVGVLTALVFRPDLIESSNFAIVRGMATLWMVTTAVFFTSWISPGLGDTVRHAISPGILLVDWFVNAGPKLAPTRYTVMWMGPPALYLAYTMMRGLIVDWYPYYFLDPAIHGYWGVAGLVLIMFAIMAAVGFLLASWPGQIAKYSPAASQPSSTSEDPVPSNH